MVKSGQSNQATTTKDSIPNDSKNVSVENRAKIEGNEKDFFLRLWHSGKNSLFRYWTWFESHRSFGYLMPLTMSMYFFKNGPFLIFIPGANTMDLKINRVYTNFARYD